MSLLPEAEYEWKPEYLWIPNAWRTFLIFAAACVLFFIWKSPWVHVAKMWEGPALVVLGFAVLGTIGGIVVTFLLWKDGGR